VSRDQVFLNYLKFCEREDLRPFGAGFVHAPVRARGAVFCFNPLHRETFYRLGLYEIVPPSDVFADIEKTAQT
jgi:hypothetical protein